MADLLTDEQLAEIRKRADAATPGPWKWTYDCTGHGLPVALWRADGDIVLYPRIEVSAGEHSGSLRVFLGPDVDAGTAYCEQDTSFIAHSRADVPLLLDEVERLKEQIRRNQETVRSSINWNPDG